MLLVRLFVNVVLMLQQSWSIRAAAFGMDYYTSISRKTLIRTRKSNLQNNNEWNNRYTKNLICKAMSDKNSDKARMKEEDGEDSAPNRIDVSQQSEKNGSISTSTATTHASFVERTSRQGAKRLQTMSIQERTQRAMLAEAVEDRLIDLDELLLQKQRQAARRKATGTTSIDHQGVRAPKDDMEDDDSTSNQEVTEEFLIQQILACRDQYRLLVTGEPCTILDALQQK